MSFTNPALKPDPQLAVAQAKGNGESVPELQFENQATASVAAAPVQAADTKSDSAPVLKRQPRIAINAVHGSIYATAPASDAEIQAALQSGVTIPAFVPVPTANPALASLYGDHAIQSETPGANAKAEAKTEKGGRLAQQGGEQVAGLLQPTNPKVFDSQRFSAVPVPSESPKDDPDNIHPRAKLNAFFPDRPAAAPDPGSDDETADDQVEGLARLISAPGLARVAPNGIWIQTPYVETDCFKPNLVHLLHEVEKHFGKPPIVTSGYRTAIYNREAGGVNGSMHTACEAADIQVRGVSKTELASYVRSLPDRGGVGTYCYTNSVHVDTGSVRDWNWRCRRKKKKHR